MTDEGMWGSEGKKGSQIKYERSLLWRSVSPKSVCICVPVWLWAQLSEFIQQVKSSPTGVGFNIG